MKALLLLLASSAVLFAQDWQSRGGVHLQVDLSKHYFVSAWSISNFRTQTINTTSLFGGIGYRGNKWWLEGMVWRQWNSKADQWALDIRFDKLSGRWHFYAEEAPYLTKKANYEFVIAERRTWKGFSLGGETENTHQPGTDVAALGPRLSRKLGKLAGFDVTATGAIRFSPTGGYVEPRLYLMFNRRIAPADRK